MRQGQHSKKNRGRNRRPSNPGNRVYESNGPDVKIRGNASHVSEKYLALARDAQAAGDPIASENYLQHAEHYLRIIAATQQASAQQKEQGASEQQDNGSGEETRESRENEGTQRPRGRGRQNGDARESEAAPQNASQQTSSDGDPAQEVNGAINGSAPEADADAGEKQPPRRSRAKPKETPAVVQQAPEEPSAEGAEEPAT